MIAYKFGCNLQYTTLIDEEDLVRVSQFNWSIKKEKSGTFYVRRSPDSKLLHRFIMKVEDWEDVDHINHDGLDNRKSNLRVCEHRQNCMNARKTKSITTSKYKGVAFISAKGKWRAEIRVNGKKKHLGYFLSEEAGAEAYNKAAAEYFGNFALLNRLK